MRKQLPDQSAIRSLFDYSEKLRGLVYRQRSRESFASLNAFSIWNSKWLGKKAGSKFATRRKGSARYTAIKINGKLYYEHLLVMAWHGITVPDHKESDHIDNDPTNNTLENLRIVDRSLNVQRQSRLGVPSENMGIKQHRGRWMARATINKRRFFIGYFSTPEEAAKKRVDFIEKMRGEKLNPPIIKL